MRSAWGSGLAGLLLVSLAHGQGTPGSEAPDREAPAPEAPAPATPPGPAPERTPAQGDAGLSIVVLDARGRAPVPFAALALDEEQAIADAEGRHRFATAAGPHVLVVIADGYGRLTVPLELLPGEDLDLELHLQRGRRPQNQTVVRSDPPWRETERQPLRSTGLDPGLRSLSSRDLERQPGALADPLRALQALPETGGDVGNQAFVLIRGAPEAEVAVEIDGIAVHHLTHLTGLVSLLNRDLLDGLDLYASAPPADRPDALTGGLYARYRDQPTDRFDGTVDLNLLGASLVASVALDAGRRHALTIGVRQSFVAGYLAAASLFDGIEGDAPSGDYGEYFLRYRGEVAPRHTLRATFYASQDRFQWDDVNERHATIGGALDWRHDFGPGSSVSVQLAHSSGLESEPEDPEFRYVLPRTWSDDRHRSHLRARFDHAIDPHKDVAFGLEASSTLRTFAGAFRDTRTVPSWSWLPLAELDVPLVQLDERVWIPEVVAWLDASFRNVVGPLGIRAGLRASAWNRAQQPHASPRIALNLPLPTGTTVDASFALLHQQRLDVLSLEPSLAPRDLLPERAFHLTGSVSQALPLGLVARVEGWHRAYDQLLVSPDEGPAALSNDGHGQASGLDVTLQLRHGRLGASAAYGLSRSTRVNPLATAQPQETAAVGDRRHFAHAGVDLSLGRRRAWHVSGDYLFRSGWTVAELDRVIQGDGRTALWAVASLDGHRRADLHRVSARLEGTHRFRDWRLRGSVEVTAVLAGGGAIEDCPSQARGPGLPECRDLDFLPSILPWLGLRADW